MTYGPSTAQRFECHDREPNISHPARPNTVITHFIVWIFSVRNFEFFFLKYYAIDRRARNNHKNDSTINTFPFCFRVRTGNSHFIEKRGICFHLYSLLSLIFGHKSGQCFSFNIFCPSTLGPGGFSGPVARFSGSWWLNGPVKLFCFSSRWFQML